MNASELFDELRAQYPGCWHRGQLMTFRNRVRLWREDARARGVEIGRLRYRQSSKPRTRRRPDPLESNWAEMLQSLEADPDQTSHELLAAFMIRYPGRYEMGHLRTVQRRMKIWRHDAVQRLIIEMGGLTEDVSCNSEGYASNTKAFTTAALAILVDEGKLHWDDKVIDYLPEFRLYDAYVTREFTIRDLVTHRSGLGLGAGDLLFFPNSEFTTKDIVHALRYLKPVSGFRAEYAYDNNLYVVAGELIPAITGQTWADFVTTRILAPLNMAPCVTLPQQVSDHRNQASPHASVEGKVVPITPDDTSANAAAAAMQCNVTQLAKWQLTQLGHGQASAGPRIFSEAQSELMWTPQTIVPPVGRWPALGRTHFDAYGLGWFLEDFNGYKRIFHSGTLGGMMTYQSLVPELNLGVIVLTNADVDEARRTIALAITDNYTGGPKRDWVKIVQDINAEKIREHQESDAKRQPVPLSDADLVKLDIAPYVGTYKDAWRGEAWVTRDKEGLTLTFSHTKELSGF